MSSPTGSSKGCSNVSQDYQNWAAQIRSLAAAVRTLEPLAAGMDIHPPGDAPWHGALFQHLLPQANDPEPLVIVAVTGGTNTGKSTIFNHLAGGTLSRSERFATKTKHPLCVLPEGVERPNVATMFPDFEIREWTSEEDPAIDADADLLFVRQAESEVRSQRLVLLDTPDVDGVLRENWRRADMIRHASDVLICALTDQKYNDAAVVQFFREAAMASKTLIAVVNFVEWPEDRELCLGWLKQFEQETGATIHYAYAAPRDRQAAIDLTLPFHPLTAGATNPVDDLTDLKFAEIKIRSNQGSLARILADDGLPRFLTHIGERAAEFTSARDTLIQEVCVRDINLPRLPTHLVWAPIWEWLEPRRTTFDVWVHGTYSKFGRLITRPFRKSDADLESDFLDREWESYSEAIHQVFDKLRLLKREGSVIVKRLVADVLSGMEQKRLFDDLRAAHREMPLCADEFSEYVHRELDSLASSSPGMVKWITRGLVAGAVLRPALTVGLIFLPGVQLGAFASTSFGTDVAIAAGIEGIHESVPPLLQRLLRSIFAEYYRIRSDTLTALVHDRTTGPVLSKLDQFANIVQARPMQDAVSAIDALATMQSPTGDQVHDR